LANNSIVNTSSRSVAMSDSTRRSFFANFFFRNDSFGSITRVDETFINRFCSNQLSRNVGVYTFSSLSIARISCASIVIIAEN